MDWSKAYAFIEKYQRFVIVSHVGLEGDAVGSEIAFCGFLKKLGKSSSIINDDAIPQTLTFLITDEHILQASNPLAQEVMAQCDAVCVLDVSNWHHIGETSKLIQSSGKPVMCIDHHKCDNPVGDFAIIDATACSTGIQIYDLISSYSDSLIDIPIARAIYTAILTDTGNFRFSNTNAEAYTAAANLLNRGLNHSEICTHIYENNPWSRMRLLHAVLGTLKEEEQGKIAWMVISRDMLSSTGSAFHDSEGFVDLARTIKGVEISILFREIDSQKTKATFRSKQSVDVHKLASFFGGGGHARASGATIFAPIDEAIPQVLNQAKKMFHA